MKNIFYWLAMLGVVAGSARGELLATNAPNPASKDAKVYSLSPNDIIQMKVYQEEDLDSTRRIAKDGTVTMPLVGVVNVGGKSVEQAARMLQDLYAKDYLVNPQVGLIIVEYSKRNFTVLGQVQKPGSYEMPNEQSIDLLRAIGMAGGYTRIGAPTKITVQRKVGDEVKIFKLDAEAMAKEKNAKPFEVLPEDTVTVGEKFI